MGDKIIKPPDSGTLMAEVAVIGAGNVGKAMAAHLSMNGHNISLFNRTEDKIHSIRKEGCLRVTGVLEGCPNLNLVTTSIEKALQGKEIIMVTVPASGHDDVARLLSPHLEHGQLVVLNPGRTFGSLAFTRVLRDHGTTNTVAEAQTILYTTRYCDFETRIFAIKNRVGLAAFPGNLTGEVIKTLRDVIPQYDACRDTLEIGLSNVGAILHPAPTLMNIGWVENPETPFKYYYQGITPSIARFLEGMDQERLAIAKCFGYTVPSVKEWLEITYSSRGGNLWEALHNNISYSMIDAPESIDHRYIYEDVPTGLVPMASLGRISGSITTLMDIVIDLASAISNRDYRMTGRSWSNLGLEGMDKDQMREFFMTGHRC